MLSSVLNGNRAIAVNIQIMRTFARTREGHRPDINSRYSAMNCAAANVRLLRQS